MKRWMVWALLVLGLPGLAWAEVKYVQVEKTRLLARPSAFSKAKAVLAYQAQVEVLGEAGAYVRVQTEKGKGYVSWRSLATTRPDYSARLSKQYVSSEEVAMATKGFNAQVESEYRQNNPNLPYGELDRLEQQTSYPDPASALAAFRQTGKLGEFCAGGEAQ